MRYPKVAVGALGAACLLLSAACSTSDQTIQTGATDEIGADSKVTTSVTEPPATDTGEYPSLLDYSNVGAAEVFVPYRLDSPEQLRDTVAATLIGELVAIDEGYAPEENWGMFPGTFHARFAVEYLLGGQQDPGDTVVVAIRLDRAPGEVASTLEVLRKHIGESYLLFLTPEYARGTGQPTGNFVLAPEAPAAAILVADSGDLQPISAAEELLGPAIRRGEAKTGVDDPTADDPVNEANLAAELRNTYMGSILDYDRTSLIERFVAPVGKTADEIGITGDVESLQRKLEQNANPTKVE